MSGHQSQSGQLDWTNCFSAVGKSPETESTCPFPSSGAGNLCLTDIVLSGSERTARPGSSYLPRVVTLGTVQGGSVKTQIIRYGI